jgi:iron complex outermembrane recepter protein
MTKNARFPQNTKKIQGTLLVKWSSALLIATRQALVACAFTLVVFPSALWGAEVEARSVTYQLDIPSQDLQGALQALALASHHKLLYRAELVAGKSSHAVHGSYTTEEAVRQMLAGTDLDFEITPASVVLIKSKHDDTSGDAVYPGPGPLVTGAVASAAAPAAAQSSGSLRLASDVHATAQTDADVPPHAAQSSAQTNAPATQLEEVIVTAQKRAESIQTVPVPVSVLNAQLLVDNNMLRLQDYTSTMPGLMLTPGDDGGSMLTIRGVSAGPGPTSTVGVLIDDVPYGPSTTLGGGGTLPDFDPSDLQRIEELRGPQGTLYGASSLGGLLKFVTIDPSTEGVSGRVQATVNSVYNGDGPGYGARGAINVPLSDTLAVRLTAFARRDAGYIDDPLLHINGINWTNADWGRLSALWHPSDTISLKVSSLLQNTTIHGYTEVGGEPGLGDLQQHLLPGSGYSQINAQADSATLNVKLGSATLTAITGYNVDRFVSSYDLSPALGGLTQQVFGVSGTNLVGYNQTDKFNQELRLSLPLGSRLEWLLGAFYTHERSPFIQYDFASNFSTGAPVGLDIIEDWGVTFAEYAAFTDLTYQVTDRFDVQFGGRESANKQTYWEVDTGPLVPYFYGSNVQSPVTFPETVIKDHSFTYLATPRFKFSDDLMAYARLASGYRPGGPNAEAFPGTPPSYAPDKTQNYELGIKGDALGRALTFDASLYDIEWQNIQLLFTNPVNGNAYFANGSRARSRGLELSLESRPVEGLTVSGWVAFNDAKLTEPFPSSSIVYGVPGDRLPYGSRFSSYLSLDDQFFLTGRVRAFVGAGLSYVGEREGQFTLAPPSPPPRQFYPAYAKGDLHGGLKFDAWSATLFINNFTDRRGLLTGGIGTNNPNTFAVIQPRTVGLTLTRTF